MLLDRITDRSVFNSLRQMETLQRQLEGLLSEENHTHNQYPPLNIWASEEGAIVEVKVPGIQLEDIEITVLADSLTIKGTRTREALKDGESYHRQECAYGTFVRTIQMPFKIDAEGVKAELNRGILEINLPRAETDKPRKVSVKLAQ